jgi:hypothetical protein
MKHFVFLFVVLGMFACTSVPVEHEPGVGDACHVIYDAGSSGTRLYIYQLTDKSWLMHTGPRMPALADPIRRNRKKTMADADAVTDSIVAALEEIRQDGPLDGDGTPRWKAFDWMTACRLDTVAVYATAGMRIAEQQNSRDAKKLWEMLNSKLSTALSRPVNTRTLTGFEEGLFAWLATHESQDDGDFGIAEMGGGSAQISFPCEACDASRLIQVQGVDIPLVSYSFLGMGQDEAWKQHVMPSACKPGSGMQNPDWQVKDCTDGVILPEPLVSNVENYVSQAGIDRWYLTGAFLYSQNSDFDDYCLHDLKSPHKPESSCFRAIYQPYFLKSFGVPVSSGPSNVNWTLGAAICALNSCLSKAGPPECQWSRRGCID